MKRQQDKVSDFYPLCYYCEIRGEGDIVADWLASSGDKVGEVTTLFLITVAFGEEDLEDEVRTCVQICIPKMTKTSIKMLKSTMN